MKKQLKRLLLVICTGIVTFSAGFLADGKVEAAVKTPALSKKNASLTVGKSVTLKVKKGTDNIKKVTWKSDKKKIATVKKSGTLGGKVTAKAEGNATITAKVKTAKKTYTLKCKVTCKKKAAASETTKLPFTMKEFEEANSARNIISKYSGYTSTETTYINKEEYKDYPNGYTGTSFLSKNVYALETPVQSTLLKEDRELTLTAGEENPLCTLYMDTKDFQKKIDAVIDILKYDQSKEKVIKTSKNGKQITFTTEYTDAAEIKENYEFYGLEYQADAKLYGTYTVQADTLELINNTIGTKADGSSVLYKIVFQYGTSFEPEKSALKDILAAKKRNLKLTYAAGTEKEISKTFQMEKKVGFQVVCAGRLFNGETLFTDAACETLFTGSEPDDYSDLQIYLPQLREATAEDRAKLTELMKTATCGDLLTKHTSIQTSELRYVEGQLTSENFWRLDKDGYYFSNADDTCYITKDHYVDMPKDSSGIGEYLCAENQCKEELDFHLQNNIKLELPETETLTYTITAGGKLYFLTELKDKELILTYMKNNRLDEAKYNDGMCLSYCYIFDAKSGEISAYYGTLTFGGESKQEYFYENYVFDYDKTLDLLSTPLKDYFTQTEKRKVTVTFYADDEANKKTTVFEVPKGISIGIWEKEELLKGDSILCYKDAGFTQEFTNKEDNKQDDLELWVCSGTAAETTK